MTRFLSVSILFAMLLCAPWLAGTWSANGIHVCEAMAGGAFAFWFLGLCIERRMPRVRLRLLVCVAALLAQGWWMALRAGIHPVVSSEEMLRVSGVLAVIVVVCDLSRAAPVRMALWIATALAGFSIAMLGIAQRFHFFPDTLRAVRGDEGTPFATFNYHGNAGSFLNIVLPAVFGLAYLASRKKKPLWMRAMLAPALVAVLVAVVINVSRGAMAISVVMLIATGIWAARQAIPEGGAFPWRSLLVKGALVVALIALVSRFANGATSFHRWEQMVKQPTGEMARLMVWRITWPMAIDAGPFGNGPGTFKMLLPKSPRLGSEFYEKWIVQPHEPGGRISMWSQAHQDYLQTLVEWGGIGAAMWGLVLFGGLARLSRSGRNHRGANALSERTMRFCTGIAIIAVCVNAAFDFPFQLLPIQLQLAMWLGLAWSAPEWEHPSHEAPWPPANVTDYPRAQQVATATANIGKRNGDWLPDPLSPQERSNAENRADSIPPNA